MAPATRLLKSADAERQIPRVFDDAEYVEAGVLLAAFQSRYQRLERDKHRLRLENHFGTRLKGDDTESDKPMRAKLAELKAEPALSSQSASPSSTGAASPAIARAIELLKGAAIGAPPDFADQIAELDRQQEVIWHAIAAQQEVLDEIANDLSYRFATMLKPSWDALQLEFYRAAQRLCQVTRQVQDFRRATLAAGIRSRSDLLMTPNVRAPLILGSETEWNSEISGWRRILEGWGLLK